MEIQEYEYQGEKGILLKNKDTRTNVFLTWDEIDEIVEFLIQEDIISVVCWADYIDK